jgi:hypothetical protein
MKKKYLLITLLIISALIMSSCGRRVISSAPAVMMTPMPAAIVKEPATVADPDKTCGPTDEEEDPESEISRENYELLRLAALELIPEDGTLETDVLRKLVIYGDNTMILARILPNTSEEAGPQVPDNVKIMQITAETYMLSEGTLTEQGIMSAPILVKISNDGLSAENVYVPEMYDPQSRAADITSIFGVSEESELALNYDEDTFRAQSAELSSIKYDLAVNGAFDGFASKSTLFVQEMESESPVDPEDPDYAVREYYMHRGFGYSELTLPAWYEFGREESADSLKLYAVLALSEMQFGNEMGPTAGIEFTPVILELEFNDGVWKIIEEKEFDPLSETYKEDVAESYGEYASDCLAFASSPESEALISELESIQESIILGDTGSEG